MTAIPSLLWGVKQSLREYIESLEDGVIDVLAPTHREGTNFCFAYDPTASDCDVASRVGVLQFRGSVVFSGHWGALRTEIHDPRLTLDGTTGTLSVRTNSVLSAERFESIASGKVASGTESSTSPTLTCELTLTPGGRMVLGQQYAVGQAIDELSVSWQ